MKYGDDSMGPFWLFSAPRTETLEWIQVESLNVLERVDARFHMERPGKVKLMFRCAELVKAFSNTLKAVVAL